MATIATSSPAVDAAIAHTKMERTRTRLLEMAPWFGALAMQVKLRADTRHPFMATDGTHVFYNVRAILAHTEPEIIFVWAHEILHCGLFHMYRKPAWTTWHEWNVCTDLAINGELIRLALGKPPAGILHDSQYANLSAEQIARLRQKARQAATPPPPPITPEPEDADEAQDDDTDTDSADDTDNGEDDTDSDSDSDDTESDDTDGEDSGQDGEGEGTEQDGTDSDTDSADDSNGTDDSDEDAESGQDESDTASNEDEQAGDEASDQDADADDSQGGEDGSSTDGTEDADSTEQADDSNPDGTLEAGDDCLPPCEDAAEDGEPPRTRDDWEMAVEQAVAVTRKAGKMDGGIERIVAATRQSRTDWREILRQFIEQQAPADYSFRRPNKRLIGQGLYMPGTDKRNTPPIVVAIDTSGSIGQAELDVFATEINIILCEAQPREVVVIYCDTIVNGEPERFTPEDGEVILRMRGGGGTLFRPVFDWVADACDNGTLSEPPCAILYLTDGFGSDVDRLTEPEIPVLWAIVPGGTTDLPFGEVVQIEIN